jgi:hypothetical protein
MYRVLALLMFALFMTLAPAALAESAPETDEAKFIRLTRHLEEQPMSDVDKSMRTWLIDWAAESEDITVLVCDVLDTLSGEELPHVSLYTVQMIFGNAAFQIANPDKRDDLLATQLAAARSALKAYSAVLAGDPTARIPHLDHLIEKDAAGTLESHMSVVVADKCADDATSD